MKLVSQMMSEDFKSLGDTHCKLFGCNERDGERSDSYYLLHHQGGHGHVRNSSCIEVRQEQRMNKTLYETTIKKIKHTKAVG